MRRNLIVDFAAFVFMGLIGVLIAYLMICRLDERIEEECSSCRSPYEWCDSYWKDKKECGYSENIKTQNNR